MQSNVIILPHLNLEVTHLFTTTPFVLLISHTVLYSSLTSCVGADFPFFAAAQTLSNV